jgi:hypothetical protein
LTDQRAGNATCDSTDCGTAPAVRHRTADDGARAGSNRRSLFCRCARRKRANHCTHQYYRSDHFLLSLDEKYET